MLKVYGSLLCKDCVACKAAFEKRGIAFEYHDFAEDLAALKEFLRLRDSSPLFEEVKKAGGIGIPCIVGENGCITLDYEIFLK